MPQDEDTTSSNPKTSEDILRNIAERSPVGIVVIQDNKILFANQELARLIGTPLKNLEALKPDEFLQFMADADKVEAGQRLKSAQSGEVKTKFYDFRIIDKKGKEKWIQILPRSISVNEKPAFLAMVAEVTEQKRIDLAYRELVDHSLQGLCIIQNMQIVFANQAFSEISGYTIDELLELTPKQVQASVHPDYQGRVWGRMRDRLEGKPVPSHYQFKIIRKDGQERWLEMFVTLSEFAGKPAIQATFLDITERQEADVKLKESEAKYRGLFDDLPIGLYRTTAEGDIIDANPALVRLLGAEDKETLLKMNASDFYVNRHERQRFEELLGKEGIVTGHDVQFKRLDGKLIWVHDTFRAFKDEFGNIQSYEGSLEDITDRKLSEDAVKESEAKYRALVDQSLQGIIIIQDNRIVFANPQIKEVVDVTRDELLDMPPNAFWDRIYPDDIQWIQQRMQDRFAGKKVPDRYPIRVISPEGTIQWVEIWVKMIEYQGKPAIQVTLTDVTERIRGEQAIKESEEKYRTLVEQSLFGIVISRGPPLRFFFVNEAFADMIGYTIEAILAMTPKKIQELIHPSDRDLVIQRAEDRLMGKEVPNQYEYRMVKKDGSIVWVAIFADRIEYEGEPAVQAAYMDITERKQAEAALQESEERFRALVEDLSDWVWEMDISGKFVYTNNAVEDIIGFSAGQILGRTPCDFLRPEDVKRAQNTWAELIERRKPIRTIVIQMVHRDESDVILEARGRPIFNEAGELLGFRGICRDITDRLKMLEQLRELDERL